MIGSTPALKTGFHKGEADSSFKASSAANVNNMITSKSFKFRESNDSGQFKVRRTLDSARMDLQNLLELCKLSSAILNRC